MKTSRTQARQSFRSVCVMDSSEKREKSGSANFPAGLGIFLMDAFAVFLRAGFGGFVDARFSVLRGAAFGFFAILEGFFTAISP